MDLGECPAQLRSWKMDERVEGHDSAKRCPGNWEFANVGHKRAVQSAGSELLRTGVVSLAGRRASSTTEVEWGPSFPDQSNSAERALGAVGARSVVTVDDVIVGWTPFLLTGSHPEPQQVAMQAVTDSTGLGLLCPSRPRISVSPFDAGRSGKIAARLASALRDLHGGRPGGRWRDLRFGSGGRGSEFIERIDWDMRDSVDHHVTDLALMDEPEEILRREVEASAGL